MKKSRNLNVRIPKIRHPGATNEKKKPYEAPVEPLEKSIKPLQNPSETKGAASGLWSSSRPRAMRRAQEADFRVAGLGFRVCLGFIGFNLRIQASGFRVLAFIFTL